MKISDPFGELLRCFKKKSILMHNLFLFTGNVSLRRTKKSFGKNSLFHLPKVLQKDKEYIYVYISQADTPPNFKIAPEKW